MRALMSAWEIRTFVTDMTLPDRRADLVREPARLGEHLGGIERQHLSIAHEDLSVDDRRTHVVAARDVYEVGNRIVHRRLPRRRHRHDQQVRALSRLERTNLL